MVVAGLWLSFVCLAVLRLVDCQMSETQVAVLVDQKLDGMNTLLARVEAHMARTGGGSKFSLVGSQTKMVGFPSKTPICHMP